MTIYVCETVYHVMLSMLLLKGQKNIILCTTHEKKNMENFLKMHTEKFPNVHFVMRYRSVQKERLGIEMIYDNLFLMKMKKKYGFKHFKLVNFAWSINSIDRSSTIYYKSSSEAIFFEEGAMGSIGIPQSRKKLALKKMLGIPVDYFQDDKLIAVYVQNPDLYDNRFGNKMHSFDLKELVRKSEIGIRAAELFVEEEGVNALKEANGKVIVFTQPLSEDGFITESQKIEMYKLICSCFPKSQVLLKTHPRDTTSYSQIDATVIYDSFPSEVFDILGISFSAAIGICTSAVNNVTANNKVNINDNFLKDTKFSEKMMKDKLLVNGVKIKQ